MAIIRELLIKIGFVSDKKAINATNTAISGFKTRFALAATAATYAFSKIAGFFGDIATATLDAKDLADTLGISVKQLTQLTQGLKGFRLDDNQIKGALSRVNKLFNDFRTGASNELANIARGKFDIDRNAGPVALFKQILEYIGKIETQTERIRIAESIFGEGIKERIADVAVNLDKLVESVTKFDEVGQKTQDSIPALEEYAKAVQGITNSWNDFTLSISKFVFPVLQTLLEYLTIVSDLAKNVFTLNGSGVKTSLNAASSLFDPLFEATGLNNISEFFKGLYGGNTLLNSVDDSTLSRIADYIDNKTGFQYQGFSNPAMAGAPNIVNNIDIQVPQGTTEDQARFMSDQLKQAVDDSIWETFRQIQNNNPTVE